MADSTSTRRCSSPMPSSSGNRYRPAKTAASSSAPSPRSLRRASRTNEEARLFSSSGVSRTTRVPSAARSRCTKPCTCRSLMDASISAWLAATPSRAWRSAIGTSGASLASCSFSRSTFALTAVRAGVSTTMGRSSQRTCSRSTRASSGRPSPVSALVVTKPASTPDRTANSSSSSADAAALPRSLRAATRIFTQPPRLAAARALIQNVATSSSSCRRDASMTTSAASASSRKSTWMSR